MRLFVVQGIHPTPASTMATTFYAASSVNVQPDPSQFQFRLPAECDQSCHNTFGSYTCSCVRGYQLAADRKSCLGKVCFTRRYFHRVPFSFSSTPKLSFNACCLKIFSSSQSNPLHPNFSIYILGAVLGRFHRVHTRKICLTIRSFFSWLSFPLFL